MCVVMGDMCALSCVNGVSVSGVCVVFCCWLAAVGCVGDLGGAVLPFVLNLFLFMRRNCLSCCARRYCGVVGVRGVIALWVHCGTIVMKIGFGCLLGVAVQVHGVLSVSGCWVVPPSSASLFTSSTISSQFIGVRILYA